MQTLLVLRACLPLLFFCHAVRSYSFDKWAQNYTEEEMKALMEIQEEFQKATAITTRSSGLSLIASCDCNVDDTRGEHDTRIFCGCCLGFSFRSKSFEACIKGGIMSNPSAMFLTLKILDNEWTFTFEPEICVSFPSFWFVKFCLGIYHHNICLDRKDWSMSAFKICFQADIVVLIPVLTIDFNCIHYHDKKLEIDSTMHSARAGLVSYKVGHGIRGISKSTDDGNSTEFFVGDLSLVDKGEIGLVTLQNGQTVEKKCRRINAYKEVCGEDMSEYRRD